jgi:hypothetical protein
VQEGSAVRLFWNPNEERDLGGYRIERSEQGQDWTRLGVAESATFLDREIGAAQQLNYRVLAFDRSEPPNVSGPSAETPIKIAREAAAP